MLLKIFNTILKVRTGQAALLALLMWSNPVNESFKHFAYLLNFLLRRDRLLSESTIQKFRTGQIISSDNLDNLCKLLECQPGDILEYVPDNEEK